MGESREFNDGLVKIVVCREKRVPKRKILYYKKKTHTKSEKYNPKTLSVPKRKVLGQNVATVQMRKLSVPFSFCLCFSDSFESTSLGGFVKKLRHNVCG